MDSRSIRKITETDFPKFIIVEYEKVSSVDYYIDLLVHLITTFYYLAKKWKLLRTLWRAILLLISPLFWFLYAILFIMSIYLADDMQHRFQFMDHEEIAEITKSPFPSYMILYHHSGSGSFLGDHTDKKSFMFFRLPSDSFYHAIDSLTLIKDSGWSKDANNKYTYQMVWDAKDSPNGDDLFLTIEIEKGSRLGHMRFGSW